MRLQSENSFLPTLGEGPFTGARADETDTGPRKAERGVAPEIIALIDGRGLERECFVRSIELLHPRIVVVGFANVEECLSAIGREALPSAIIVNVGGRSLSEPDLRGRLDPLLQRGDEIPVVILGESEDIEELVTALDCGASGYVPVSVGIEAIIEATKLAASGGVFLSLESIGKLRHSMGAKTSIPPDFRNLTTRQQAVADALRQGKANKAIAYELNMCESTVKVHIRNIMRKLKATNRTEAAFKLNAILPRAQE
jgi:DNA-binding NarL/FixJ family response regulator